MEIINKSVNITKDITNSKHIVWAKYIFLFFLFFPYITLFESPWSLQPYAFFVSIVLLFFFKHYKINYNILILLIVAFFSILISVLSLSNFINSLRSIANYISLPIIIWALYKIKLTSNNVQPFVKTTAYIYIIVGLIQLFIYPGFLTFLVPHQGNTENLLLSGRGVSSLTPEPSYFGFLMLLYFFIALLYKDKFLIFLSSASILLLAQSFSAIICLIITILLILSLKNIKYFLITIILFVALFLLILNITVDNTRSFIIMQNIITNGFSTTIENDASATGRLYHITYPIVTSFSNFFIPFGYNGLPNGDTRILSGIAGAIYELGFFSFIIFFVLFNIIYKNNNIKFNLKVGIGIGLLLFILNANQFGMPIFGFILSYFLYTRKQLK